MNPNELLDELDGLIDTIGIEMEMGNKRGHEIIAMVKKYTLTRCYCRGCMNPKYLTLKVCDCCGGIVAGEVLK